jgi:Ran-binding protein 3
MSPKPQVSKPADRPELLPQTSDDKFKASGFGSLAKSSSPFGGLASPGSQSPFGAASHSKLGSFAGSTAAPAAPASGFGALGGPSKSTFGGGSTFGSSLGGGFGAISGAKSALSSFETPSDLTIKGLKSKATAFGTPGHDKRADGSDDEENSDDDDNDDAKEERQSSQPLLSQQRTLCTLSNQYLAKTSTAHETGEEGETTIWTGRAKLYTMVGEGDAKGWKERGVGTFKFNITVEEPKKARFVLRADGTHRLLLNAAVTKQLVFGGDSNGEKPKEGRLLFNTPNTEGVLEMHLLKVSGSITPCSWTFLLTRDQLKSESAVKLWEEVSSIQESEL